MEPSGLISLIHTMPAVEGEPFFASRDAYRCRRTSYKQVYEDGLRFSSLLAGRGIGKGDRIIICGPSSPLWVSCFIGSLQAGVVVVPLDEGSSADFTSKVGEKSCAKLAIVQPSLLGVLPKEITIAFGELPEELQKCSPSQTPADIRADDLAEIIFTSGTTAEPKGVILTHGNISANFAPLREVLGGFGPWMRRLRITRFLGLLPLSHMFGQVLQVFIPLMTGSPVIFLEKPTTAGIIDSARLDRSNLMVTVPRFLSFLKEYVLLEIKKRGKEESFWRRFERCPRMHWTRRILLFLDVHRLFSFNLWVFLVGGARLEPELEEFWRRLGFSVWQGYGLTEAAPIITFNNPFRGRVGSIGRVVGKQDLKIAEDGEILVRGPNVMSGYFEDATQTKEAIQDGWLRTGDLARMDSDGNLYFAGRKKDLIVMDDGRNIYPGDVERVLRKAPGVRDSVVLGLEREGKVILHAVLLMEEGANTARAVRAANGRLEPHQRISSFTTWPDHDFPRTPTQKIRRGDVLERIRAMAEKPALPRGGPSRIREALVRIGVKTAETADPKARLGIELGLSSLDRVELASILEGEFQAEVTDDFLGEDQTLEELEQRLTKAEPPQKGIPVHRYTRSLPLRMLREGLSWTLLPRILRSFCRLTVSGVENLAGAEPPLIFIANHTSYFDGPIVALSLPRRFSRKLAPAMTTEQFPLYFDRESKAGLRKFLQGLGYHTLIILTNTYPIPPHGPARKSLKYTGELLDAGWCPLIFPEGARSPDGAIHKFMSGIGLVALEMRVPIVPIRIDGLFEVLPMGASWPKHGAVRVSIGCPVLFTSGTRESVASELGGQVSTFHICQ